MSDNPLCVAFLWHMHQPDYGDTRTGEIALPWTRFHGVKDYYDMGALAEQVPDMHLTINVVPSLMDQLVAYGTGTAQEAYASLTLRDAGDLDEREKTFVLRAFFQLPISQMVHSYARYRELLERRGAPDERGGFPVGLKRYTTQDYRDLQLWYNLAWCGNELRRDPEIAALFAKGTGFTEQDKKRLLEVQNSFMARILPFYRRLMESHKIEISVSPYYHPILPLLCNLQSAREALPSISLPPDLFAHPEDAKEQIQRALDEYTEIFGRAPRGMWPSEGAISDAALVLAREAGLLWLASDEAVLWNSLQKEGRASAPLPAERKFCAYRWGDGEAGPCLFFRDHALSDLIGFTYCNWTADQAAADFLTRLHAIRESLPNDGKHYIVPVILDGENAWEYYPQNGAEFLGLLYRRISESEGLRTVTFSEFLDLEPHRESLRSVVAGSWIYGNLATWIGHPEKNRAWEALAAARRFLSSQRVEQSGRQKMDQAFHEVSLAEGSDWFWWYGDDHQTENAAIFDSLFRNHLKKAYALMGTPHPLRLDEPINEAYVKPLCREPVHTITPILDGKVTDYFEWLAAGFATPSGGEAMHRTERFLERVFFGFDLQFFYLRIDLPPAKRKAFPADCSIQVQFGSPQEYLLSLECGENNHWHCRMIRVSASGLKPDFAGNQILELRVPLEALGVREPTEVTYSISVLDKGLELERFPSAGFLAVRVDPWELDQKEWIV